MKNISASKMKMSFEIGSDQFKKLMEWKESLPELKDTATTGGAYTYTFTPTGLGLLIEVKRVDGHKIDLTDSNW